MTFVVPSTVPSVPRRVLAILAAPAVVIFLSSNFVNVGNLAFNMVFSRLMGPEAFSVLALLLTIKLAFLGIMGAGQMAVSQHVADQAGQGDDTRLARLNQNLFALVALGVAGLCIAAVAVTGQGAGTSFPAPHLLMILLAAIPFGSSLSLLRGMVFGRMQTGRIVASANVEMAVRLAGGIAAWMLGLGIEGVVAAISLSIIAGWVVLADLLPLRAPRVAVTPLAKTLAFGAAPFGLLQLAQVLALDGDIFLAKSVLSDRQSGFIAALSLFQRIQFFACFSLAGVLLPSVIHAARRGQSVVRAAMPVVLLFGAVSVPLLALVAVAPDDLIRLLVGADYATAAAGLGSATVSAVAFTGTYLLATFLLALKDWTGAVLALVAALVQMTVMAVVEVQVFTDLLTVKVTCQSATVLVLLAYTLFRLRNHRLEGPSQTR